MNDAPIRCNGYSRYRRTILPGMMSVLLILGMISPPAKAVDLTDQGLMTLNEVMQSINSPQKERQEKLLFQLIAANDDLVSLNHANPYLPNSNIDAYDGKLVPVYNDMILTQKIVKLVNALKKELPRKQTLLSKLSGKNTNELQELKEEIFKRTTIYKDYVCAYRSKRTSNKVNTQKVCSSTIKNPSKFVKAEIINPYMALLSKLQNITQQLILGYLAEEAGSYREKLSPSLTKQITELNQDIQELIALGKTIQEENQT